MLQDRLRRVLTHAAIAGLAVAGLPGCASDSRYTLGEFNTKPLPLAFEAEAVSGPIDVDIDNPHGDVIITVTSEVEMPEVRVQTGRRHAEAMRFLTASFENGELRVQTDLSGAGAEPGSGDSAGDAEPEAVAADDDVAVPRKMDLLIRVPSLGSVTVRAVGGRVKVYDPSGDIDIANSALDGRGGDVMVKVGRALDASVSISAGGHALLVSAPGSRGRVALEATGGEALFSGGLERSVNVSPQPNRYAAVVNDGDNPVTIEALDGDARFYIRPDPLKFTAGRGD
jgi:hypothetical protein